ncbi:MAG TPA: DNA adenine methylase [Candidatus Acidoferrum sp.]|nr:DNA adenine methylase [Candidatus Acidoferrum sp.]
MKNEHAKPILSWPGGKRCLLNHLLPRIPKHNTYVEPFCGALAVFCAKEPSKLEVINDTHKELVSLYLNVKYHWSELDREFEFLLNSRAQFYEFIDQPGLTEIQRAARWLVRRKNCFADDERSFGRSKVSGGAAGSSLANKRAVVDALHRRLDKTIIEHRSWQQCVAEYDSPETFFFFDPPYIKGKVKTYAMWAPAQMQELRDRLTSIQAKWLLTTCDSPESREIFRGLSITPVVRAKGINNKAGQRATATYGELIVAPA